MFIYGQQSLKSPQIFGQIRIWCKEKKPAEVCRQLRLVTCDLWTNRFCDKEQPRSCFRSFHKGLEEVPPVRCVRGRLSETKQKKKKKPVRRFSMTHRRNVGDEAAWTNKGVGKRAPNDILWACVCASVCVYLCLCVDTSRHKAAPAFQPLLPLRLQVICTVIPAE